MSQAPNGPVNGTAMDTELKSVRVKEAIRDWIARGELAVGEQLPSEPTLVEQFAVSRSTVRESIASLAAEGLVRRVHGKGTFVAARPVQHRTVAVVMPYLFVSPNSPLRAGTEVIPSLTQAIEAECRRRGMGIMLFLSNNDAQIERENLTKVRERNVDAVIVNFTGAAQNVAALRKIVESGLPLVMIDVRSDEVDCPSISTDNRQGAFEATRALHGAGARQILYMTGPVANAVLADRQAGYLAAMERLGLQPRVLQIEQDSDVPADEHRRAYELGLRAFDPGPHPVGVLAADAVILTGVWRAAQHLGLQRDRLVLACFDDPALNVGDEPRIIRVVQPLQEIGRLSVQIIEEELKGHKRTNTTSRRVELPPKIEFVESVSHAQSVGRRADGHCGALA